MSRKELDFKTTEELKVPEKLVNQVIGQEEAIRIARKVADQRRNILLIGEPGTGKSMVGLAVAEMLEKAKLKDILCYPNPKEENTPIIKEVPAGDGRKVISKAKMAGLTQNQDKGWMIFIGIFFALVIFQFITEFFINMETSDVLKAADRISATIFMISFIVIIMIVYLSFKLRSMKSFTVQTPKLLIDNSERKIAPFEDATGTHEGALLGDVRHDPFQSGGLGTPPHERVEPGAIHRTNGGVLFIDEVATLKPEMQIDLLTAMQEKKYPITGRSERSAGALVKTQPVPCDFILIAAGNVETIAQMNPALRSRIRGYGYEIYMNTEIPDTPENREKIAMFVAQEIKKDGKIPHFSRDAVMEIINEAKRRAGRKGHLTLRLRDLGGLVRVAGDICKEEGKQLVNTEHVIKARKFANPLEQQIADRYIQRSREYRLIKASGTAVGRVNGLAVISSEGAVSEAGLLMPIEAAVTPSLAKERGSIIATGKLGEIAQEAVKNVSAIFKKYSGKDISAFDTHIQFLQTYQGVEGDSASISVAAAVLSALQGIPVKQDYAMTGSLSIRGEVLPVGGVTAKIEAAVEAGMKHVVIPKMNEKDVLLSEEDSKKIKIHPVSDITEVLELVFDFKKGQKEIIKKIKKAL